MAEPDTFALSADRFFNPNPAQRHPTRKLYARVADHFCLFRGRASGARLNHAPVEVFGIRWKRTTAKAEVIYNKMGARYGRRNLRRAWGRRDFIQAQEDL